MEHRAILSKLSRYEFRRELGRGSSGVVYDVFDRARGRNVALKIVPEAAEDLAGEFLVMARLPPHPVLARPLDYHPLPPCGCFTMELARGAPLSSLMRDGKSRELIGTVLPAVLAGLSVIHSNGLLHGDLKPSNIVIDRDAETARAVRIVDLGLSRSLTPAPDSRPSGTWRYIAPEMFLGHPADARADLYALGVILHEWLTGAPPYPAESLRELARRVLFESPPSIDPGVVLPEPLFSLPSIIRKLLSRRPEERYPDCVSVMVDLGEHPSVAGVSLAKYAGGAASAVAEDIRATPVAGLPADVSGTVFLEPPFIDRDAEMAGLEKAFDMASLGTPVFVTLTGAPGAGRTRLLRELRYRILSRVAEWHEEPPGLDEAGRDPLARFAESLARSTGVPAGRPAGDEDWPGADARDHAIAGNEDLPPADARDHAIAGDEGWPGADAGGVATRNRLSERVTRLEQLLPLVAEALEREAPTGTVVGIFEGGGERDGDLETSLEFLSAELKAGRLLLILVTGEVGDSPAPESERRITLNVPPLEPAAVSEIVRFLAGSQLPEDQLSRVVAMSGGVPLHAVMLTRAACLASNGGRPGMTTGWLPASHEEFFRRERERHTVAHGPAAREILEAVAVLEPWADLQSLIGVTGIDSSDALEALAGLSGPGGPLVPSRHEGRSAHRFVQPVFSEWIESQIEPSRRKSLHRRAALALAARQDSGTSRTLIECIAGHWCAAGGNATAASEGDESRAAGEDATTTTEAIRWCHEAGIRAAEEFDWTGSRAWIGRALDRMSTTDAETDPDYRRELVGLLAQAAALSGSNEEAAALFRRLADEAPDPVIAARAVARHAQIVLATLGDSKAGNEAVTEALARLPEGVADLERARLLEIASDGARIRGEIEDAVSKGLESLRLLEKTGAGPGDRCRVLATLGYSRLFTGDAVLSRNEIGMARELARTAGDLYGEARALSHLAVVEGHLGDYGAVRRHLEASAEVAERIHDVRRLTAIDQSLAVADYYEARFEDARRRLARGRRRAVAIGDRQILAYFDLTLGNVERSSGRFDAAEAAFRSCEVQAAASGIVLAGSLAGTGLGWVALCRGRLAEARRHLTGTAADAAQDPLATMQGQCVLGLLSLEENDPPAALELAGQAMESARRVGSPKFEPLAIDLAIRAALECGEGPDELLTEWERGFELSERLQVAEYAASLLASRARVELKAGRPEAAADFAGEAVRRARSHGLLPVLVRSLHVQARAWMAQGGLWDDRAEDILEECVAVARETGMEKASADAGATLEALRRAWEM